MPRAMRSISVSAGKFASVIGISKDTRLDLSKERGQLAEAGGRPDSALAYIAKSDDGVRMRYPGGKSRCYQRLINLIPPHRVYMETHLGGGAVLRKKTPAEVNIGVDRDRTVISRFRGLFG